MKKLTFPLLAFSMLTLSLTASAQQGKASKNSEPSTYIDKKGVMRWSDSKDEVCAFGINYSTPFSYFDIRKIIGADMYAAMDEDVYHFARLGLDGYRIHVWDTYISDADGNIVDNEHLKMYDYLQYKLKERGIKMYITPINHYTDSPTGYASVHGGKNACLTDPKLFHLTENYLTQFLNHVNPYTGIAYKDDPDIVAFEIVNEPSHWAGPEHIKEYIDRMYNAMRETGCEKPILYNMTTCAQFIDTVLETDVQGGSFQWYPTGLTSNFDVKGNHLPFVDKYDIPFEKELKKQNMFKFAYEFSPADIGDSGAMYPAMARGFREAGFQFVAQFAYDPMHAAFCNVDYKTHFLNMAYTPEKSMGMMIGSEVFHEMAMYKSSGRYPENNEFGSTELYPKTQLAEFNTSDKFLYTKSTSTAPKNSATLEKVAGTGSSKVVKYSGNGIYILDKLESGVWRLEVMPDAFWVRDPFFTANPYKEVAVTIARNQNMEISLPDLGSSFTVKGLNAGNNIVESSKNGAFSVTPGAYLLTKEGVTTTLNSVSAWNNITLGEFHAPTRELNANYVLNDTPQEVSIGSDGKIAVTIVREEKAEKVELFVVSQSGGTETIEMKPLDEYRYEATLPAKYLEKSQIINYHINVKGKEGYQLFPYNNMGATKSPSKVYEDDIKIDEQSYKLSVVSSSNPLYLFSTVRDWNHIIKKHRKDKLVFTPTENYGGQSLTVSSKSQFGDNAISVWCRDVVEARMDDLKEAKNIEIYASSNTKGGNDIKITLVMRDGSTYGATTKIDEKSAIYSLPISKLKQVEYIMHPLAYPQFRSDVYKMPRMSSFDISEVEKVQISVIAKDSETGETINIEWIRIVK
ncbi:MAG: hypothetical protein R3Y50_04905 [Rikenellaceae bacterium]